MHESLHPQEEQIIRSWNANAKPWSRAIQTGSIQSRTLVTDRAIIDAVSSVAPRRVLDVGCGEGWLARALSARGMTVTGVDAVPELIALAAGLGGGEFHVLEYRAVAYRHWRGGPYDAAVCNFSLLGGESVRLHRSGAVVFPHSGELVFNAAAKRVRGSPVPRTHGSGRRGADVRHFNMQGSNPRAHCDRGLIGSRR